MRKILFGITALFLLFASPVQAVAASQTIGLINLQKLLLESEPAAVVKQKMEEQFAAEKKELDGKSEQLKKMSEQIRLQAAALTPEAREDKKLEFMRVKREFEDRARAFTRKVQAADAQARQEILMMIAKACSEYGKKKKFDVILDAAHASVVFANPALDITDKIMVELNRIWRAGKARQ